MQPDATQSLYSIIKEAGYVLPQDVAASPEGKKTITKADMVRALAEVRIDTIGPGGANDIVESWTLNNAQITSVNFDSLDYTSDEILNVQIGLKYDWAELNVEHAIPDRTWTEFSQ